MGHPKQPRHPLILSDSRLPGQNLL